MSLTGNDDMNLQSDDLHLVCHKILFQIRVLDWTFVLDK